jgi:sialate O-acetylesterase
LRAAPSLPHLFSDHMVIQRGEPIEVWGWAEPGERISVSLAGVSAHAVTEANREWRVTLAAMNAGGPFALEVRGSTTIRVTDVMIGEVWVASGQSNMVFELSHAAGGAEEAAHAENPELRFFSVPKKIAIDPQKDTRSALWQVCTPERAKSFSAVGYFFAKDLQKKLGVPVGVILSAWSGSAAEEWTPPDALRGKPILQPILEEWDAQPAAVKSFAAQPGTFEIDFDEFELLPANEAGAKGLPISNFQQSVARISNRGSWRYDWASGPGTWFELAPPGRDGTGFSARTAGNLDGTNASYLDADFSGDGAPVDLSGYDGVRFWARGNGAFQYQSLQPSISDWDNYAGPIVPVTPDWKAYTILFRDLKQAGWGVTEPFTLTCLTGFRLASFTAEGEVPRPPSGLFEGMMTPLTRYRIRGAIWYQGESNGLRGYQYRTLLPALIRGWRDAWNEGDFPFLIVQLPNHGSGPELGDSAWAELREAQLQTAVSLPHTGLAVTIDVGARGNVHPARKKEVGERAAKWALGAVYGQPDAYTSPVFDSASVSGGSIRIHFKTSNSPLEIRDGGILKGFAIAGADREFHWAAARIDGDTVVVSSDAVFAPVSVRYDWADDPHGNLFNRAGLPASPFRTDDWPGVSPRN